MASTERVPVSPAGTKVRKEDEIDLLELFFVIWQKAWILVLSLLAGAIIAALWTHFMITPQYRASSMIYIFSKSTSLTSLVDLQVGTQLTGDFQILATSRPVVEEVIEELNLDATYEQLVGIISVTNPGDSRILQITVTHPDPELAADISNAMADALRDRVAEVTASDRPTTVESAVAPSAPYSPNMKQNVMFGGMLAFCAAGGVIVLLYLLDDTIKSEEDVARYLGLNVLAAIPVDHTQTEVEASSSHNRKPAGGKFFKNPLKK